jgi:hypothetical protein
MSKKIERETARRIMRRKGEDKKMSMKRKKIIAKSVLKIRGDILNIFYL